MKKELLLFYILFIFAGCAEDKPEGVQVFDFSVDYDKYKSLNESNYKLTYEIVPLEATDRSLIYMVEKVAMNDNYIYTISEGVNVKIFNRKGKYLNTITHGRANNELIGPNYVTLDDKTGNVIFLDGLNMIKTYDSVGNFINCQKTDILSLEFAKIGDKYLFYDGNISQVDSNFVILKGEVKKKYSEKKCPQIVIKGGSQNHITQYNGDYYFMADYDCVLYKMGENDDEPIEYAVFNNVISGKNIKKYNFAELVNVCRGRKFTYLNKISIINEELMCMGTVVEMRGCTFLYDKSSNTPYRHPLSELFGIGVIRGTTEGKTLHCITREFLTDTGVPKLDPQAQVLYSQINAWEKKNGIHENPYLVIVSYNKKK